MWLTKTRKKARSTRGGFTLLEVLAAVVIVGVALSVLALERNRTVDRVGKTDRLRLATVLAQNKLHELLFEEETAGSGTFEDHEGFAWEVVEGTQEFGDGDQQVTLAVYELTVRYDDDQGTVTLSAVAGR